MTLTCDLVIWSNDIVDAFSLFFSEILLLNNVQLVERAAEAALHTLANVYFLILRHQTEAFDPSLTKI